MQQYRTQLIVQAAEAAKKKQEVTDNCNNLQSNNSKLVRVLCVELWTHCHIPLLCSELKPQHMTVDYANVHTVLFTITHAFKYM
jgi:hypothetical protein